MADYLPLKILEIRETKNEETGEIRKSAVCSTVQPETVTLNMTKLDAARLQRFMDNIGNIVMVPIRRGEINGRAYTAISDGHIFRDSDVVATFELSEPASKSKSESANGASLGDVTQLGKGQPASPVSASKSV